MLLSERKVLNVPWSTCSSGMQSWRTAGRSGKPKRENSRSCIDTHCVFPRFILDIRYESVAAPIGRSHVHNSRFYVPENSAFVETCSTKNSILSFRRIIFTAILIKLIKEAKYTFCDVWANERTARWQFYAQVFRKKINKFLGHRIIHEMKDRRIIQL